MSANPKANLLNRNLRALAHVDPSLARRIALPASQDHLEEALNGDVFYHYGRLPRILNLRPEEVNSWPNFSPPETEVIIAGVGLGETVDHALSRRHSVVRAWERDPMIWRLALSRHDWTQPILSGRLLLYLGIDCVQIPNSSAQVLWAHPVLEALYTNELNLLRQGLRPKRALICEGELFVRDIAEALQDKGYSTYTWSIESLAPEELAHTVAVLKPDLAVAVNFSKDLSEACSSFNLPLAIWEIDPSTEFLPRSVQPQRNTTVFTYRKARVKAYAAANFPRCVYLPLASNTDRRRPEKLTDRQRSRFSAKVSFVGASMVQTALKFEERFNEQVLTCYPQQSKEAANALLQEVLTLQRQDLSRWVLPELLEQRAPGFIQACQARGLDNPIVLAGEIAAAEKRLTCVARLGALGIQVWGDKGWKRVQAHGVLHRGYAGHFKELNRIYIGSEVNIDIGRFYQNDIVPMRIFDILACGGFVIAEYTPSLEGLFQVDHEIACWRTPEELIEKTTYFLNNPTKAREIADRGRARVLKDHRIKDRIQSMIHGLAHRSIALAG